MARWGVGVVISAAVIAAGCSSEDGGVDAYSEALRNVTDAYVAEVAALPVASTDGDLEDARLFFTGMDDALGNALMQLGELSPPDGLEAAHAGFVDSVTRFADVAEQAAARGQELESRDDLITLANDPVVGVANYRGMADRMVAACSELQVAADANPLAIDLGCSGLGRTQGGSST